MLKQNTAVMRVTVIIRWLVGMTANHPELNPLFMLFFGYGL